MPLESFNSQVLSDYIKAKGFPDVTIAYNNLSEASSQLPIDRLGLGTVKPSVWRISVLFNPSANLSVQSQRIIAPRFHLPF